MAQSEWTYTYVGLDPSLFMRIKIRFAQPPGPHNQTMICFMISSEFQYNEKEISQLSPTAVFRFHRPYQRVSTTKSHEIWSDTYLWPFSDVMTFNMNNSPFSQVP